MVLTDPDKLLSLPDFGIQIPIRDSKITKTLEELEKFSALKGKEWKRTGVPLIFRREDLERVHSLEYVATLYDHRLEEQIIRTFELLDDQGQYHRYDPALGKKPLKDLRDKLLTFASGTFLASEMALKEGFVFFTGGGMHHGHFDHGSGFCLVNDILLTLRKLQYHNQIQKAWVIDIDAHKGDGTAALTEGDSGINTLSIHMAQGWPLDPTNLSKAPHPNPVLISSDVEIPIEEGQEPLYLPKLKEGLEKLEGFGLPDLAIVVGGSDPYEKDELPSTKLLRLTLSELLERDMMVFNFLRERSIPTAWLMAGGYGDSVWEVYTQFLKKVLPKTLG